MPLSTPPKALFFDVFGTCVNWRATVTRELYSRSHATLNSATASLASDVRLRASQMELEDWGAFAQQWRNSYKVFTRKLAGDPSVPYKTVDEHHLDSLKQLLRDSGMDGLWTEDEVVDISLVWHRLEPWADTAKGIQLLNTLCYTATLSNGNVSLLKDLDVHGSLGFTHLLSAEMFNSYKPSPKVYLGGVERLGLKPEECAMVAAHLNDLKAAKSNGMRAIYVERVGEEDWDSEYVQKVKGEGWVDLWVDWVGENQGFITVAEMLGAHSST